MSNSIVDSIELLFCMCGPLERKCTYCERHFQEDPHNETIETIHCIFCGNITYKTNRVKRDKKVIKAERKN